MAERRLKLALPRETKRRLANFLPAAEQWTDRAVLAACVLLLCSYLPLDILNINPATGGDTGSHFWPLVTLVKHALPNFSIRVWNPGNLGGEPHFVHYFPLPYLIMAVFSLFVPLGMAFNFGALLQLLLIPAGACYALRRLAAPFPIPTLGAVAALFFVLNESYSMWGGNALSTLAGQFAHGYGLAFLLFGLGAFAREIRLKKAPLLSSCCFSCVAISHSYVLLGLPFFMVSFLFFPFSTLRARLGHILSAGLLSFLLAAWFLIPLVHNSPWTTAFAIIWRSPTLWREILSPIFLPLACAAFLSLGLMLIFSSRLARRFFLWNILFWGIPILGYSVYYLIFPKLGLVDVRAVPQILLFGSLFAAVAVGLALRSAGRLTAWFVLPVLTLAALWWIDAHVKSLPNWLVWNLSGWEAKPLYPDLNRLTNALKGDFSKPRVVYEHSDMSQATGTIRVFEMLPYFSGRATLESLYLQASILAPMAYRIQAEVSKTPSCPFPEQECPPYNLLKAQEHLRLLGVGELIIVSEEVLAQAQKAEWLEETGKFGIWHLFRLREQPALVEVLHDRPALISDLNWKPIFIDWFKNYDGLKPFLVHGTGLSRETADRLGAFETPAKSCHPQVRVSFSTIELMTNCPGVPHYLKFAYHPTWKASSGDDLFLVSPGFIGIVPSTENILLSFGQSWYWRLSALCSVATAVAIIIAAGWSRLRSVRRGA